MDNQYSSGYMQNNGNKEASIDEKRMKKKILILFLSGLLLIVLLIIGGMLLQNRTINKPNVKKVDQVSKTPQQKTQTGHLAQIVINPNGFNPQTIFIKAGDAVEWINYDSKTHLIASDPFPADNLLAGFKAPAQLTKGQSYLFTFTNAGTYTYHDDLNPYNLKGVIIVTQ